MFLPKIYLFNGSISNEMPLTIKSNLIIYQLTLLRYIWIKDIACLKLHNNDKNKFVLYDSFNYLLDLKAIICFCERLRLVTL